MQFLLPPMYYYCYLLPYLTTLYQLNTSIMGTAQWEQFASIWKEDVVSLAYYLQEVAE
jgi:hypothetical protein